MWRRVVSQSPTTAVAREEASEYLTAWKTINKMIREGRSLSGHERHCCFLNTGGTRFADVSASSGLDLEDDGRGVAVVDWDHDGDLDIWVTNRTGPRIRYLQNNLAVPHHFLAVRLEGRSARCNRDAVGARVELHLEGTDAPILVKTVRAGSGFLAQSCRSIHFGLGKYSTIIKLVVRWPDGALETINGLEPDRRYRVVQGTQEAIVWRRPTAPAQLAPATGVAREPADSVSRIALTSPLPLRTATYRNLDGSLVPITGQTGPMLINLWASWCAPCIQELAEFTQARHEIDATGLKILALLVPEPSADVASATVHARQHLARLDFPFDGGLASHEFMEDLDVMQRSLVTLQTPLPLPSSVLLDSDGQARVIYKGPVSVDRLLADVRAIGDEDWSPFDLAVPFPGRWHSRPRPVSPLHVAMKYIEGQYLDAARDYLQRWVIPQKTGTGSSSEKELAALSPRGSLADLHHFVGTIHLEQGERDKAVETFREALQADPDYWRAHFDLGIIFIKARENRKAAHHFSEALRIQPDDADMLNKLGLAMALDGRTADAVRFYAKSLAIQRDSPDTLHNMGESQMRLGQYELAVMYFTEALQGSAGDAQLHFRLASSLGQLGRRREALLHFREALRLRPDWQVVANNVAWILATHPDPAVRNGDEAVELAQRVCDLVDYKEPTALDTLAVAYAAAGRFTEAAATCEKAIELAQSADQQQLVLKLQARLRMFQADRTYVEEGEAP